MAHPTSACGPSCQPWHAPVRCERAKPSVVWQLGIDVRAVDQDVWNEHLLLDLLALEIIVELVDANTTPREGVQLDGQCQTAVFHGTQGSWHAIHARNQR